MNFFSKKTRLNLIAKTLILTSIFSASSYVVIPNLTIIAHADTSIVSNEERIKNKILTALQDYQTEITFTPDEYTSLGIVKDTATDPKNAYFEVLYEHPEIFWTALNVNALVTKDENGNVVAYTLYIFNLYDNAEINSKKAEIDDKVNAITNQMSAYSDLRKVYEIHDYICDNVTYDHSIDGKSMPFSTIDPNTDFDDYVLDQSKVIRNNVRYYESHSIYGALINGTAVCEGYAKLAKLLFNKSGIESGIITSETHGWNYVKVNGNYYELDTTWDDYADKNTTSPYKYFNITNNEIEQDTDNGKLHIATSGNVPSCTDATFDNIFRNVNNGKLVGNNVVRIGDKLYELNNLTNEIYSCDLSGNNKQVIKSPQRGDLLIGNLVAYNGNLYYESYRYDSAATLLLEINKIDLSNNEDKPILNLNSNFSYTYDKDEDIPFVSFYIDNGKTIVTIPTLNDGKPKTFDVY